MRFLLQFQFHKQENDCKEFLLTQHNCVPELTHLSTSHHDLCDPGYEISSLLSDLG